MLAKASVTPKIAKKGQMTPGLDGELDTAPAPQRRGEDDPETIA